jgi:hypothetical protein
LSFILRVKKTSEWLRNGKYGHFTAILQAIIFLWVAVGGMVAGDILRMIEEAANDDPVQLQNGFSAYDECSNIRKNILPASGYCNVSMIAWM